jgi:hypothetical protein
MGYGRWSTRGEVEKEKRREEGNESAKIFIARGGASGDTSITYICTRSDLVRLSHSPARPELILRVASPASDL